jgi:hypothetical protein
MQELVLLNNIAYVEKVFPPHGIYFKYSRTYASVTFKEWCVTPQVL